MLMWPELSAAWWNASNSLCMFVYSSNGNWLLPDLDRHHDTHSCHLMFMSLPFCVSTTFTISFHEAGWVCLMQVLVKHLSVLLPSMIAGCHNTSNCLH